MGALRDGSLWLKFKILLRLMETKSDSLIHCFIELTVWLTAMKYKMSVKHLHMVSHRKPITGPT